MCNHTLKTEIVKKKYHVTVSNYFVNFFYNFINLEIFINFIKKVSILYKDLKKFLHITVVINIILTFCVQ